MIMLIWEWNPSRSQNFKWQIAQGAQRDDGTWPPDIPYAQGLEPENTTITAEFMTHAEAAAELAKLGTEATFTVLKGSDLSGDGGTTSITGLVAGYSEGSVKKSGVRPVTLTLTKQYKEA
jgi:hypothetical protein